MGYTHYWSFGSTKGAAQKTELSYKRAIKQCQKIIQTYSKVNGGISGYTAHTKLMQYGGVNFNGAAGQDCEDFVLREHYSQNLDSNSGRDFCKTNRLSYDTLVVACLIVLKHYLGDKFYVASDGDKIDWSEGLILAKKITGLKSLTIPESIRSGKLRSIG